MKSDLAFTRSKFSGIDGNTKVRFTLADKERSEFYLESDIHGLVMKGYLEFESMGDLQVFAKILSDAYKEHQKLIPKIERSFSGH